jgi:hypothetical protein
MQEAVTCLPAPLRGLGLVLSLRKPLIGAPAVLSVPAIPATAGAGTETSGEAKSPSVFLSEKTET